MPSPGAIRQEELVQRIGGVLGDDLRLPAGRGLPRDSVVAVAMSGGVDSSVAAALVVATGADAVGVTMRLWGTAEMERGEGGCCSIDAVEDARRVCGRLGIPHYVLNMAAHFRETVVGDFLSQYALGLTPNPCVRCNEMVKFAELWRRVGALGATHIASGHYAQVRDDPQGGCSLHRGIDQRKDQSYTLYRNGGAVLSRLLLPLGWLQKSQVRSIAAALGLAVASKPDSQELCFVGGGDHRVMLERELAGAFSPGPIRDLTGQEVGQHRGLPFYTVGQRQGLGLAVRQASSEPHYVVRVDASRNTLVVGTWQSLLHDECRVGQCVFLDGLPSEAPRAGLAQLRAHGQPVPATWRTRDEGAASVEFSVPQPGIAPGQSLVLYDGDRVIAGGEIAPPEESEFA
ncbi:MAG: tRNA 2-thiouridine(34) synthase MnmA [Candidatus Dormiibacterota bacterium]